MEPFKNKLSPQVIECIGLHLNRHLDNFDQTEFVHSVIAALPSLELKQRTQLIAEAMFNVLPEDVGHRHEVLYAMLHPDPLNHSDKPSDDDGMCGWGMWPLAMLVGQHGISDFEGSMALLKEMTKRGTAEFDVRPFLDIDQARALAIIIPWTKDENVHVRRLATEGTRPRLPWGMQLKELIKDPEPTLPILNALRDDSEEYVRRSVANHLNDIAKDHPDRVANLALKWMKAAPAPRKKLIRHACRSLIKQGHPIALQAFGVEAAKIEAPQLTVTTKRVKLGEALKFSLDVISTSAAAQKLILDYVIHFRLASGTQSAKVFKWSTFKLEANEQKSLSRSHTIRHITTRKFYTGDHWVSLRINGKDWPQELFYLEI